MYQGKFAAFVAAMSVCVLLGGCGGGGGRGPEPPTDVPTFVVGTVVDEQTNPLAGAKVSIVGKPQVNPYITRADGRFQLDVSGQQGFITLEAIHPNIGSMQQLINLADAKKVGNMLLLEITSGFIIKRAYREVHLEEAYVRVSGATLIEYSAADDPKPQELIRAELLDGPQDLTIGYKYLIGDPRVTLEPEYVNYWYLYPSAQGRAVISALYQGPRPDMTRVFVTLDFVNPTDGTPPTVAAVKIPDVVKGDLMITGTTSDPDGTNRSVGIPVINLSELAAGRNPYAGKSRDYNGHHIEGAPTGVERVMLRYSGNVQQWILPQNNGSFSFAAIDTTKLPEGQFVFEVKANDFAGNVSEAVTLETVVDNVPDPPPTDPWDEMPTIDRPLVMVDEEARPFDSSTWPKEGTPGSFGDMVVGSHDELIVHMRGGGDVFSLPREGGVFLWPDRAPGNGTSTFSPQGYLYVSDLGGDVKRFDPATGKIDKHVADSRLGTSWLIRADNTGALWVYGSNGHFTCLSSDLSTVLAELDVDAIDIQGFAADLSLDSLIWYKDPNYDSTQIMRRQISTSKDIVLDSISPGIGIGGIEFDPTHGQVLIRAGLAGKTYLVQLGKKADREWGELYRTEIAVAAGQLVRGANFNEYYTTHSDQKARRWHYQ